MDENPTEVMIRQLMRDQTLLLPLLTPSDATSLDGVPVASVPIRFEVLACAVEPVNYFHRHCPTKAVYIHLGVNGKSAIFSLERYAYNNMSFRCPDQLGYQPDQTCIAGDCALESALETCFPVQPFFLSRTLNIP